MLDERPSPLAPGYRLGRYELLCPVATGGMASVWLARLHGVHGFEKLVAVKTILPAYAEDQRFQQMFLDEARLAARIEHANVVRVVDLGEEDDILFLVMEWIEGDSIARLQKVVEKRNEQIPIGIICRLMADVLAGLQSAHDLQDGQGNSMHVVHRDVSPQNVLVTYGGVAKLIDFGIAKARDRMASDTREGLIKGKLHYMPVEQALGKTIDARADVYAVGAVMYHLLSNRPVFDAPNEAATLHVLVNGRPPLPLPDRVPKPIANVVMKALSHKRDGRYESAEAMRIAIENALIEIKLHTSTPDVAAYLAKKLADRIENRRKAVEIALDAAGDRVKLQQLLFPAADAPSGVLLGGAYLAVTSSGGSHSGTHSTSKRMQIAKHPTPSVVGRPSPTLAEQAQSGSGPTTRQLPEVAFEIDRGYRSSQGAIANVIDLGGVERDDEAKTVAFAPAATVGMKGDMRSPELDERLPPAPPPRLHMNDRAAPPASSGKLIALGAVALIAIAGGLFELTSHGAFFRNDLIDLVRASRYVEIEKETIAKVRGALGDDTLFQANAAIAAIDAALADAPRHAPLLAWAAYTDFAVEARFGKEGARHARATARLDRLDDGLAMKRLAMAVRDLSVGEVARARTALQKLDDKSYDVAIWLGEAELRAGEHASAAETFRRAIALRDTAQAHQGLARALEAKGDFGAATDEATKIATKHRAHAASRLMLARLAWRNHDEATTLRRLDELDQPPVAPATSSTEQSEAAALRGFVHLEKGRIPAARAAFEAATLASKGKPTAQCELGFGELELLAGDHTRAIAHFKSAFDADPSLFAAQLGIARAQLKMGLAADAKATLAKIKDPRAAADVAKLVDQADGKAPPKK